MMAFFIFGTFRKEKHWTALQFTGFLGIGLLFHSTDLPKLTQLLLMFHQYQPVDMLMRQFISLQVSTNYKCGSTQELFSVKTTI